MVTWCHLPHPSFHALLTGAPVFCLFHTVPALLCRPMSLLFAYPCALFFSTTCPSSANRPSLLPRLAAAWFYRLQDAHIIYWVSVVCLWIFAHGWHKCCISNMYSHYDGSVTINGKVSLICKLVKNASIITRCRWQNVTVTSVKHEAPWSSEDLGNSSSASACFIHWLQCVPMLLVYLRVILTQKKDGLSS